MDRLIIDSHPRRIFKAAEWRWSSLHQDNRGYLSTGDPDGREVNHGVLWAFAAEEPETYDPFSFFAGILDLERPFVAAEAIELDGKRWAIGFFEAPERQ
jgi:hypothetical protein